INAELLMKETGAIAFSDIGDIIDASAVSPKLKPLSQIPEHARRAIAVYKVRRYTQGQGEVEVVEVRLWDKLSALDKLMKLFGLGHGVSPIKDILYILGKCNPDLAAAATRLLMDKVMARRKGMPPPEPNNPASKLFECPKPQSEANGPAGS